MSKREEWTFLYTRQQVCDAAKAQEAYHQQRLDYWRAEEERADAELRSSVEFREHQVTGGEQIRVVLDPEKQEYLNTAKHKAAGHRTKWEDYARWVVALSGRVNGGKDLELTFADLQYFGLASVPGTEER